MQAQKLGPVRPLKSNYITYLVSDSPICDVTSDFEASRLPNAMQRSALRCDVCLCVTLSSKAIC